MKRLSGPATSIIDRQRDLIDEFMLFDDWAERYQYLIDLGETLPPLPSSMRTDANRIAGCYSETYLAAEWMNGRLQLQGASEMPALAGLLAIAIRVYSGEVAGDILRHPPKLFDQIGLTRRLSPHRRVALLQIHERLIALASGFPEASKLAS
ncbi:SufE family protein [Rhizobium wenxiniae]|uniref:SufE family protein n=1 Tax=Rhizobium wenxiniae TaxID=1737357 RepID=UPI003C2A22DB